MIRVHHLNNSRSQRVLWLLEELSQHYEVVRYQRNKVTMLAPDALKGVHPLGKSPVVEDDGRILAETGRSSNISSSATAQTWRRRVKIGSIGATVIGCITRKDRRCRNCC
jgi:hypothetical protein